MSLLSSLLNVMGQGASDSKNQNDNVNSTISIKEEKADTENINIPPCNNGEVCRKLLEWKFIDFSKAQRCPIFDVDPVMLKRFVGHNVIVRSSSGQEFQGCCLAIDPVSLSVILAKRVDGGKIRVITVPGYYLATIKENPIPPSENNVSVNDLDVAELYHAPSLYSERNALELERKKVESSGTHDETYVTEGKVKEFQESQLAPFPSPCGNLGSSPVKDDNDSEADESIEANIMKRKESVLDLLQKHRMPVTVKDDILEIPGGVIIQPPYTIDSCDTKGNPIIKKRLGELFKLL